MSGLRDALLEMSDDDFEAAMSADEDATATVIGLRPGHVLTQADYEAIQHFIEYSEAEQEHALQSFTKGYRAGLARAAGTDKARLIEERDAARAETRVYKAMQEVRERLTS